MVQIDLETKILNSLESHGLNPRDPDGTEPFRSNDSNSDNDSFIIESNSLPFIPSTQVPVHSRQKRDGVTRTGPKGVLQDFKASKLQHSSESDEEDATFFNQYKQQRMNELMKVSSLERNDRGLKKFGHLREIGLEQFESCVLNEGTSVKVVLHLYEPVRYFLFSFHEF